MKISFQNSKLCRLGSKFLLPIPRGLAQLPCLAVFTDGGLSLYLKILSLTGV